ncbi:ankyrin repeat domain-containing protein [Aeoliella mucimassa]|uniref:ankyrin repeat domain-containing protein n=1 Tax=Aeoliella mucimassa TaxID=2527972 RepID=UPI0018D2FBD6|nr:hypothetical protein [Aeoliella mucimassa]
MPIGIFIAIMLMQVSTFGQAIEMKSRPFHEKYKWIAEDFFDDSQVIALCKAIEANDLKEMDRLLAAGADANAKGKGNMTPLLWAYPENHPERLKKLLEHGADPNVIFTSDFNTRRSIIVPGDSVTHMVCDCYFPKYFEYVFEHGGDPNLVHPQSHNTPMLVLIYGLCQDKKAKLQRLIDLGADLEANHDDELTGYATPVTVSISCFSQFDLTLLLLESGADYRRHRPDHAARLIHLAEGANSSVMSKETRKELQKVIDWLEAHGESLEEAAEDKKKWREWREAGTYQEMMAKEVEKLKAETAEKQP